MTRKHLAYTRPTKNGIASIGKTIPTIMILFAIESGFVKLGLTPGGGLRALINLDVEFMPKEFYFAYADE